MGFLLQENPANLAKLVAEVVHYLSMAAALFFFVGIVLNLLQAQVAGSLGDKQGYAHALEQVMAMTALIAIAAAVNPIADSLAKSYFPAVTTSIQKATSIGNISVFWQALARLVVSFLIGAGIMTMTVRVAFQAVAGQFSLLSGSSDGVAKAAAGIASAVVGGLLTVGGVWIANLLISQMGG